MGKLNPKVLLLSLAFNSILILPVLGQESPAKPSAEGESVPASSPNNSDRNTVTGILRVIAKAEDAAGGSNNRFNNPDLLSDRQAGAREELDAATRDGEHRLYEMGAKITPQLLDAMNDQHRIVGQVCTKVLSRFGKDAVDPIVKRMLETTEYRGGYRPSYVLQQIGSDAFPALSKYIKEGSTEEQAVVLTSLSEIIPERSYGSYDHQPVLPLETVEAVCQEMSSPSSKVREAAAAVLGRIGPRNQSVENALAKCLREDKDPSVRRKCAHALGQLGQKQTSESAQATAKELATALSGDEFEGVRANAATALGLIKNAADIAVPALNKGLKDPVEEVHTACVNSICNFGARAAVALPELLKDTQEPNSRETQSALRLIAQIGPAAAPAVPTLMKIAASARKQDYQYIRTLLAQAFAAIGPKASAAVPFLTKMLSDQDYSGQREAIRALAEIGPAARDASAALHELAERNPGLKRDIEQAIIQLKVPSDSRPKNVIEI